MLSIIYLNGVKQGSTMQSMATVAPASQVVLTRTRVDAGPARKPTTRFVNETLDSIRLEAITTPPNA
jgi:hypothetical protein